MYRQPAAKPHDFAAVPDAVIQRSSFNRSFTHKTTFNSAYLIPMYSDLANPGETFVSDQTYYARLATPLVPVMDNMFLDMFHFWVPLRILQTNFKKLMGEQLNPGDSTSFTTPVVPAPVGGFAIHSLYDYLGVRTGVAGFSVVNYYARAYNLIYREFFRDQNLMNSPVVDLDDGPDLDTDYPLQKRFKRADYFTSGLPWPQKGPSIPLPLAGNAPVLGIGKSTSVYPLVDQLARESDGTTTVYPTSQVVAGSSGDNTFWVRQSGTSGYPDIYADLSQVTATTINSLREAFQLQRLQERDARGGTRYTEQVRAHFNVTLPDAQHRPEFLGGSSTMINVAPIYNHTFNGAEGFRPLGDMAAVVSVVARGGFIKSTLEHGVFLSLINVRAELTYQQGTHRFFWLRTKQEFYFPALSHLGEQAIYNREIFTQGTADDALVFAFQERYAEYRFKPSMITGLFRSDASASLDFWHLSQDFATLPTFSTAFKQENPPIDRVLAVQAEGEGSIYGAQFICDSLIKLRCVRPMPVYSVPGLIDHF